jgi:hypothetical protein
MNFRKTEGIQNKEPLITGSRELSQKKTRYLKIITSVKKVKTYTLIESRDVFTISLIVAALTILSVFFWGLGRHNTFFENSVISTTILSIAFFVFITAGLYRGIKLKDNLGKITDKFKPVDTSGVSSDIRLEPVVVGEGIAGILVSIVLSILLWILMAILVAVILWVFANGLIISVMAFIAMLYWIFFRALRLVFKNSNKSKGNLMESMKWGVTYTILYNFWIYGIFLLVVYLKQ